MLNVCPGTLWGVLIAQLDPFHCSASVEYLLFGVSKNLPTAMHDVAEEQETPWNTAYCEPVGFGVLWTVQLAPFHRSARVRVELPFR